MPCDGVALTVATTPMRVDAALLHDPADLRNVVQRLSRTVPMWDFTAPAGSRPTSPIGTIRRISTLRLPDDAWTHVRINRPQDFGVLRQSKPHIALKR